MGRWRRIRVGGASTVALLTAVAPSASALLGDRGLPAYWVVPVVALAALARSG